MNKNMIWQSFTEDRAYLEHQYQPVNWNPASGLTAAELESAVDRLAAELSAAGQPRSLIKARACALVGSQGRIAVDGRDWFADHLDCGQAVIQLRNRWLKEINDTVMKDAHAIERQAWAAGAWSGFSDFGHTAPDWNDVLDLGLTGLLERVRQARAAKAAAGSLTAAQRVFYESAETAYQAAIGFVHRLAAEAERQAETAAAGSGTTDSSRERLRRVAASLRGIASRPPATFHEALQLMYIFRQLQEEVEGERVRSLGGLDRLFWRFYQTDLAAGRLTREQAGVLVRYFLFKIYALRTPYNQPLFLGGLGVDGQDAVNDLSWLFLAAFDELGIYDPKFHIRVHPGTPDDFLRFVLSCIRRGNSSLVLINDKVAFRALRQVGATELEVRDYVPIGCYEPAILGREVPCTGSGSVNLAKAVELALCNGIDPLTGTRIGPATGEIAEFRTFDDFLAAWQQQLAFMTESAMRTVSAYEKHYPTVNPAPLFSATMRECVERGQDAYAGSAKYNNSSVNFAYIASTVDALLAIRRLVFMDRSVTLPELADILRTNWAGHEDLRRKVRLSRDKYGNNRPEPDRLAAELAAFAAGLVNNRPNGRGGVFKAGMISIDHYIYHGSKMGATPDGRRSTEPLSKNFSAVTAMDRAGVTALIQSVTGMDHSLFPNGSVLDILLHPSAVQGEEGLDSLLALIRTYFAAGGFAIHGNIFDARVLREAQQDPQKYANLQVRVCGWNVYFVNLSRAEQDEFIRQAEHAG